MFCSFSISRKASECQPQASGELPHVNVVMSHSQSQRCSVAAAVTQGETTVGFLSRGLSEGDAGISSHFLQHLQQSQCDLGGNCDHTPSTMHSISRNRADHQPGVPAFNTFLWSKGKQGREAIDQGTGLQITCTQFTPGSPLPASGKTKQVLLLSPAASTFTC